eukprot:1139903-Pelagomonas_calceolata.AAC.6
MFCNNIVSLSVHVWRCEGQDLILEPACKDRIKTFAPAFCSITSRAFAGHTWLQATKSIPSPYHLNQKQRSLHLPGTQQGHRASASLSSRSSAYTPLMEFLHSMEFDGTYHGHQAPATASRLCFLTLLQRMDARELVTRGKAPHSVAGHHLQVEEHEACISIRRWDHLQMEGQGECTS